MTFDEMIRILMEVTGRRRPIIHIPEGAMRAGASLLEMLPTPLLSRDAVTFVTADNATDIEPLVAEFGIQLTPMREGLRYLRHLREVVTLDFAPARRLRNRSGRCADESVRRGFAVTRRCAGRAG